jgi:phosphoesterase RecJ-like protein
VLAAYHHAVVALRRAASVVVCAHVRPDGDAVGSVLALTLALREQGISAVPTLADESEPPSTYRFLPGYGLFVHAEQLEAPEVFVALDCPKLERLGEAVPLAQAAGGILVIDHHPDAEEFGSVNVLDPTASATGQMVWRFAKTLGTPSADVAECCYVGLVTDTGRFSYDNTSALALRDAAEMIDAGVSPAEIARLVYQSRSAASLAIEARTMSRLTLANGGKVAYAWITDEDFAELGAKPEEAESLPDAVRVIDGIEAAVLLRQLGGEQPLVRVNLRAKTGFDVGAVARNFGGGGHKAASGFSVDGDIATVLPQLLSLLPGGGRA